MTNEQSNQWIVSIIVKILGIWATVAGALTIVGGADQWSAPIYDTLNYMPGSPMTWGVWLAVAGILVLVGSYWKRWMRNLGLYLVGLWCFILTAGIFHAFSNAHVSYDMPMLYIVVGIVCLVLAKGR